MAHIYYWSSSVYLAHNFAAHQWIWIDCEYVSGTYVTIETPWKRVWVKNNLWKDPLISVYFLFWALNFQCPLRDRLRAGGHALFGLTCHRPPYVGVLIFKFSDVQTLWRFISTKQNKTKQNKTKQNKDVVDIQIRITGQVCRTTSDHQTYDYSIRIRCFIDGLANTPSQYYDSVAPTLSISSLFVLGILAP